MRAHAGRARVLHGLTAATCERCGASWRWSDREATLRCARLSLGLLRARTWSAAHSGSSLALPRLPVSSMTLDVPPVFLSDAERDTIATLANAAVEPGTRCPCCNRRVNKPRKKDSPDTSEIRVKLPVERKEWAAEAFDILQQVVGADPHSYPRGSLLEAMLVLAGQHREELRELFKGEGA